MGSADPPGKIDEKLKSENMQKKQFSELGGEGRCRERLYADHIFIQIYFRKHHFSQIAPGSKGALTPITKILRTPLVASMHTAILHRSLLD